MRLDNFLYESKPIELEWKKAKDIEKIQANCSEILKIYKKTNMFLYRGFEKRTDIDKMIRKKPRKLRRPKDTEPQLQKMVDKYFLEKFGWKPRAQGVFTTSDFDLAVGYSGTWDYAHIIFPFDGFEYIWSPKIEDLYTDILQTYNFGLNDASWDDYDEKYGYESGNGYWQNGKRTIKKLDDLPNYWDEYEDTDDLNMIVVFSSDEGETTKEETWKWVPDVSADEFNAEVLSKKLKSYKNTNLPAAIKSGYEIMMLCKYYYAVPVKERVRPERFIGLYD
jgi:hypothetical protein